MLLRVAIFSLFVCLALSELQVLSPDGLKKYWNDNKPKAAIANFGYVPWGRKLTGVVHVSAPYKACEPITPFKVDDKNVENADHYPIVLAERGGCTFNQKAQNAQAIGAKMLIIVDTLEEEADMTMPIGDGHDSSVHIPTVMIGPRHGAKIKEYINTNKQSVTVAMNFQLPDNKGSTVKLDLWLSGTDDRSFRLVDGLREVVEKVGFDKIIPKPYYAIWYCPYCKELGYTTKDNLNCYSGGRYCSPDPDDSGPLTGRDILKEDLRQLCLADVAIQEWFKYMSEYSKCNYTKEKNPDHCFKTAMKKVTGWTPEMIDSCVNTSFTGPDHLLDDNIRLSNQRKVFKRKGIQVWPSVLINDFLYRGNVLPVSNVVEAICEDFSVMPQYCVDVLNKKKSDVLFDEYEDVDLFGIVLWITFIAGIFLLLALFFYRRWIRRELMRALNNQLNARISEYMAMQDEAPKGGATIKADA